MPWRTGCESERSCSTNRLPGLTLISVIDIKRIIEHLRDSGLGVLITDHNVRETLAVCERAYIVSQGHSIAHGTPTEILQDEHVKRVYLGEDFRL